MIYHGVIQYAQGTTNLTPVVYVTEYARLLGLENYSPPLGFPHIDGSTKAILKDMDERTSEIRDMEKAGLISAEDANARVLAIFHEPQVMHAMAASECRNPALRVAFHRPSSMPYLGVPFEPEVVFTTRRLRHYGRPGKSPSLLGLSCDGTPLSLFELHVGDQIDVEIIDYAWEGWKDVSTFYRTDGKPLWMWYSALTMGRGPRAEYGDNFCVLHDINDLYSWPHNGCYPLLHDTDTVHSRNEADICRVRDSKQFYDPDLPDAPDVPEGML